MRTRHRFSMLGMVCIATVLALPFFFLSTAAAQTVITTGIDTHIAGAEPTTPQGTDPSPNGGLRWDTSSGGSPRHGLLWFDIPAATLTAFDNTPGAYARIDYTNHADEGGPANLHRATVNWVTGGTAPGNAVTWDSWNTDFGGPGLQPGTNVEAAFNATTAAHPNVATQQSVVVTADVAAWASGAPNYGWGVDPTDSNGTRTLPFDDPNPANRPTLTLGQLISPASSVEKWGRESVWSYFEDIDTSIGAQNAYPVDGSGDAWNLLAHDEATPDFGTWKNGQGGFEDGSVDNLTQNTVLDRQQSNNINRPTFLFRREMTLTGAEVAGADEIELDYLSDDGMALYINGTLVFEDGMPGDINAPAWDHSTYSSTTGEAYVTALIDLAGFPGLLSAGTNLVAVELHNGSTSSSDIGFDLGLTLNTSEILGDLVTGGGGPPGGPANGVPEPSSLALCSLGALLAVLRTGRRRRRG